MIKTVYIFFGDADYKAWYLTDLTKGFSHCFSYEHQLLGGYDCFVKIENLYHCFDTDVFFGLKEDLLRKFSQNTVVKITLDVDPMKRTFDFMPINCVSLIKKQLGLSKPFIITPKQLYTHLITIGERI